MVVSKDWGGTEVYKRCRCCGLGRPLSDYERGSHGLCVSCRERLAVNVVKKTENQ